MKSIHVLGAAALLAIASVGTALAAPAANHAVAKVAYHQTGHTTNGVIHISLRPYDGEAAPRS
ncbi:MAG TPA: hypothetical protein VL574_14815 [Stellaceae bacterium]|jgi:hypothetical protein|nr:hypothetical protein [Stellaceae bacterium]